MGTMTTSEINAMPVAERLVLMEEIWGSLKAEQENIGSPEWHKNVLDKRRENIAEGRAKYLSIDELR